MERIYLDYNATTPVAPAVADAMLPHLREQFGNPSSSHVYGQRAGTPIAPIQFGAGHEGGLRPGTENVPHIVGLGAAAVLAHQRLLAGTVRLRRQRDLLHRRLIDVIPGLALSGHPDQRLPNTLNLSFPGVSGRELLAHTPAIAASVGSACHEDGDAVSGVLGAMGIAADRARGAVRLSLGEPTTDAEITSAADALIAAWRSLATGR